MYTHFSAVCEFTISYSRYPEWHTAGFHQVLQGVYAGPRAAISLLLPPVKLVSQVNEVVDQNICHPEEEMGCLLPRCFSNLEKQQLRCSEARVRAFPDGGDLLYMSSCTLISHLYGVQVVCS